MPEQTQQQPRPAILPLSEEWRDKDLVGPAPYRFDSPLKVQGEARYAYEHRGFGQVAYGWIVESRIASGLIESIDTEAAERAPGVLRVVTHRNAPSLAPAHPRVTPVRFNRAEPFLFQPKVRWHGEPVALVLAETLEAARGAAALVRVRYAAQPAALDFEAEIPNAYKPGGKINADAEPDTAEGDFAGAFERAAVKLDATYVTPHEHNMPMEPHAALAEWRGGKLTLWSGLQNIAMARGTLAKTFRIPEEDVHVLSPFIGGGFGSKVGLHPEAILAALGAKALGRPVKVAQTRQQMFANTNHRPFARQRVRLGASREGKLDAIAHEAVMQTTPHDEFIEQTVVFSRGLYAAPNRLSTSRGVKLDMPSGDIMRAPGEQPGSFALESAMDELAHALGLDPIELRIRNEPETDPESKKPFSSRNLVACLRAGAERFGWSRRPARPGGLTDGEWLVGFGVASATFPAMLKPAAAAVELRPDGSAVARTDMTDIGTGSYTVLAQILAEELGLPLERVRVELGDSSFPASSGSGGSFGATSTGSGIHMACEALRGQIAELASRNPESPLHGANGPVRLRDGRVFIGERSVSLVEFLQHTSPDGLNAQAGQGGYPQEVPFSPHAYGAQFVELGVNRVTSEIRLRRMLGAFAAGRILNERLARSQLMGGMIMGAGSGLTEESILDPRHGQFVNHDLAEYHVPVQADIPAVEVLILPEREEKANPLGTKGIGEIGIVGVAAAIANAVFNATGVRVREAPVTLDKVLAGLPG